MTELDAAQALGAFRAGAARLVALLGTIDADESKAPVPGLEWNVRETAAHVLTVVRRLLGDRRRSASPSQTAELNQVCLDELGERDPHRLAGLIEADVATILDHVYPRIDMRKEYPFHGGTTITAIGGATVVTGEFLVHGWDIGNALGRDWTIRPEEALMILRGAAEIRGSWIAPGADETFEIRLTGQPAVLYEFGDGTVRIGEGSGRAPDHVIEAGPVEFLLATTYGRLPAPDPASARFRAHFHAG